MQLTSRKLCTGWDKGPSYAPRAPLRVVDYCVPALARSARSHYGTSKGRRRSRLDQNGIAHLYLDFSRVRTQGNSAHVGELASAVLPVGLDARVTWPRARTVLETCLGLFSAATIKPRPALCRYEQRTERRGSQLGVRPCPMPSSTTPDDGRAHSTYHLGPSSDNFSNKNSDYIRQTPGMADSMLPIGPFAQLLCGNWCASGIVVPVFLSLN